MAIEYNFKYMPLVGKLSGESMVRQTETAINEIAQIVNENTAQAEIINTLAETANSNSVEALEKANEALETSGRVYITETLAVNLDNYCESQLIYINNAFSQNLPVAHKGFLEVKTNDDKTQATQVFADDVDKKFYVRTGAITSETVGDVTTYTASYGEWTNIPNSTDLANYLPVAGGTMSGDIEYSISNFAIKSNDIANDGEISVVGATDNLNGASLNLYGRNHTESGAFELNANNGTNTKTLKGDASGGLSWDGNALATQSYVDNKADDYLPLAGGKLTGTLQSNAGAISIDLLTTGTNYRDIQTFSTDGNHRIGLIRMEKDSSNNCKVTIGASNTSNGAPSGINITRGTSGESVITGVTPTATDNSTKIATTAYVKANVPASIGNANTPVYTNANGKITSTGKSFADYLPLAGGTMTGEIKRSGNAIVCTNNTSYVNIFGGTDNTSPYIALYGKNNSSYAGRITMRTGDGTNNPAMLLYPNGTATWNGDNILTDATVGSYLSKDLSSAVNLSASTAKTIISMSLPAGKWIVKGFVRYTSVTAQKLYCAQLTSSANTFSYASSSGVTAQSSVTGNISVQTVHIWNQSSTANIYLCGYATAACTAENAVMQAVRIV